MVLNVPFVRYGLERHPRDITQDGSVYCVLLVGVKEKLLQGLLILGEVLLFIDVRNNSSVIMGIYSL